MDREEYLKQRETYDNRKAHQTELLDKYLLTISTGSFGLSFLFIEKIVKGAMKNPRVLVYSWIMFAFSVISSLLSFIFSKKAHEKAIEEWDKQYTDENYTYKEPKENFITTVFNWYSFLFLLIGFVSFIIFGYYNIVGE